MNTIKAVLAPINVISLFHVILGSLFLAFCAQITIPLYPVPVTLQTLGVMLLAMSQGSNKATLSVLLYLLEASMGLPVLAEGTCNPFWMMGPLAGYLISFPIVAFVVGKILEGRAHFMKIVFSFFCGEIIIYALGVSWLSLFIGWKNAVMMGFVPFIFMDCLKIAFATCCKKMMFNK